MPEVPETTTPAVAPKSTKKAGKKKAAKKPAAPTKVKGELTGNETKVLTALKNTEAGGKMLTRAQLAEKTGIAKGWSKMLGSATKKVGGDTLEGRGLVKSQKVEDERGLQYAITAKGKAALDKAK